MQTVHLAAGINISCWRSVLQSGFTHARGHIDHATSIKLRIAMSNEKPHDASTATAEPDLRICI